jgi:hypothetical protein
MDNAKAEKLRRDDLYKIIKVYMTVESDTERQMLFPSIQKRINELKTEDVCTELIVCEIFNAIENVRQTESTNIAQKFTSVLQIFGIIYSNRPEYARKLTQQIIITISKRY